MPAKLTQDQFIKRATKKHNGYYDYSLVEYIDSKTKVKIICPKHDIFEQQPNNHLHGQRCIGCMGDAVRRAKCSSTELFIKKSQKIHGDLYDYSNTIYVNTRTNLTITCNEHGDFSKRPLLHLAENGGCPKCSRQKK